MKRSLMFAALLGSSLMVSQAADMQDVLKNAKKGNFEKVAKIKSAAMKTADAPSLVLGDIADVLMLSNPKNPKYNPLEAYDVFNRVSYSDHLYNAKVMNILREEGINMDDLRLQLEQVLLESAKAQNTVEAYDKIIKACQGCSYLAEAKAAKDNLVFDNTLSGATLTEVQNFIDSEPNSPKIGEAIRLRDSLAYVDLAKTSDAYIKYINDYPNSPWTPELKKGLEKLAYDETKKEATLNAYAKFIKNFPASKNVKDFQALIDQDQKGLIWKVDPKFSDVLYVTDRTTKKSYILAKNGAWNVMNSTGAEIVAPSFEDVDTVVYNGMFAVKQGGRWGIANIEKGDMLYPANMNVKNDIIFVSAKFALVKEGGAWGVVFGGKDMVVAPFASSMGERNYKLLANGGLAVTDGTVLKTIGPDGVVLHDATYEEVTWRTDDGFDSRFIKTRNGKKYGLVSPAGQLMFDPMFDMMPFFDGDGICIVKNVTEEGWIDTTGNYLYKGRLSNYKDCASDDRMIAYQVGDLWGFIDKTQKGHNIQPKYSALGECFTNGVAKVKQGGDWLFIDKNDKVLFSMPQNSNADVKNLNGVLIIRQGGSAKLINRQGQEFSLANYSDIDDRFSSNFLIVDKGGLKGAINPAGQEVIGAQYNEMSQFCKDYSIVKKGSKAGLYYKGKLALDIKYDNVTDPDHLLNNDCDAFADPKVNNTIVVAATANGDNQKIVLKEGKTLFSTPDEVKIRRTKSGYAVVRTAAYGNFSEAKSALVGPKGEILVKPSFNDIKELPSADGKTVRFAFKNAEGKWGVLNAKGGVEIPAFADEIISYDGSRAVAVLNGDRQIFDKLGLPVLPKDYEVDGQIIKDKATGKYGVISKNGYIRVYPTYDKVVSVTSTYAIVMKGGKYGILNY
ncbi:MAG: WG repeat-containing protein [Paludibacteraceae bacterium]|nr:WG repeat-containing protein [Candidatus Physcocola equi]MCQ2234294.1 WG repeat-containing protein [Paludibacteraceae bacterium]